MNNLDKKNKEFNFDSRSKISNSENNEIYKLFKTKFDNSKVKKVTYYESFKFHFCSSCKCTEKDIKMLFIENSLNIIEQKLDILDILKKDYQFNIIKKSIFSIFPNKAQALLNLITKQNIYQNPMITN